MRWNHALAAAGVLVGAAGVRGQAPGTAGNPTPDGMPGVTVGTMPAGSGVRPVGAQLPRAAPQVGTPVGGGQLPGTVPAIGPGAGNKPATPPGQQIDLKNVIAPYPNMPKELTIWEQIEQRYFGLFAPDPLPRAPNYTPGITRRRQERNEERKRKWWQE